MDLYNWLKAGHVIFVVALMAALLVYPRYKIHQLSSTPGEPLFEAMKKSSGQLRMIILNPSLILVWLFGLGMVFVDWQRGGQLYLEGWFHAKLLLVLTLSGMHGYFIGVGKKVDNVTGTVQAKTLRMLNEIPFLLLIAIAILVIVKPF
ncbi:putative membrane protein [Hyphomonas neptunium ATCC 15444]|uniref:Protoporphyrinogen IX oxidase n=2 Tax=Hyphomonas TaxID=85 RepID=Q0BWA6_HYPNA|nr:MULTISPECIES: CopD family protein [Hyphomonas]ABI76354.1 putative membrane protein [Hyphomonas neptunium ATCC 15444]KCZ94812.1 hypothetical protein HHI_08458 [Hyphomonas hirschiana VP5]